MAETLSKDRLDILETAFKSIGDVINKYLSNEDGKSVCTSGRQSCDAGILGFMLKFLRKAGLWPLPSAPFEGVTVARVINCLVEMDITSECTSIARAVRESKLSIYGSGYLPPAKIQCSCKDLKEVIRELQIAIRQEVTV